MLMLRRNRKLGTLGRGIRQWQRFNIKEQAEEKVRLLRVRLIPGTGKITVNKRDLENYFGTEIVKREVKRPFEIAGCEGKYDVIATVYGGGFTGQAGALRHGIARALCVADKESYRAPLKAAGFLTRDPRMKERKKYGLKKARRASQFSKR